MSCSGWLRGLCCPQEGSCPSTLGNRCSSTPQPTHVSHRDEGISQLPDEVLPVEPGQQHEAKGHIQEHRDKHVGLPGRRGPTGASGEGGMAGKGQLGQACCGEGAGPMARLATVETRAGPSPHQLGRVLSLPGAEDECELLQPVPELLTRGEFAPDEGQWPQLEHPGEEGRRMGLRVLWGSSARQGGRAISAVANIPQRAERKGPGSPKYQ